MLIGMARAHGDNVRLHFAEHFSIISEPLNDLQFLAGIGQAVLMGIRHGDDLGPGHLQPHGVQPVPVIAPAGVADHPHAQLAWRVLGEDRGGRGSGAGGEKSAAVHRRMVRVMGGLSISG